MMKMFLLLFLLTSAFAKSKDPLFLMKLTYGEKVSEMRITQVKKKFIANLQSDTTKRERDLKKQDVDHILSKLRNEKPRTEGNCPRQKVEAWVVVKGKRQLYQACLGSGTDLSKKLTELSDLLATAI
jgi:hypothetical protein